MMGVLDQIKKNKFISGSNILIIHTGGIQGNRGINQRFNLNLLIISSELFFSKLLL